MHSKVFQGAALAATLLHAAAAKESKIIPQSFQAGFEDSTDVQASFEDDAINGFQDGETFEKDAVAEVPTFALGDSSAIVPTNRYTILMVDTTCDKPVLHYARANFKRTTIVNLESEFDPALAYKAPGSLGEQGDDRQYSILMYTNPSREEIADLQVPGEGEDFDIKKFQDDNGLEDPSAGVGLVVKLGGTANCDGGEAAPAPETPETTSQAAEATSAVVSSVPEATATSAATSVAATSAVESAATSAVETAVESATSAVETTAAEVPATTAPAVSESVAFGNSSVSATSAVETGESPLTSTLFLTSVAATGTGGAPGVGATGTATESSPAIQTTNGASALTLSKYAVAGAMVALTGFLAL